MQFDPTFRDDWMDGATWQRALIPLRLLPPGRYGAVRICQEVAPTLPVFDKQADGLTATRWTRLYAGSVLWMSDTPQERIMMLHGAMEMDGHVLVAGGGLGLYPQFLQRYGRATQITIVEQHPTIARLLRHQFAPDPSVQVVEDAIEQFIFRPSQACYDSCYIDIHPTIDPRWLAPLNWLRDQCAALIQGRLRIWGYDWMCRLLVEGIIQRYLPLLRQGQIYDTSLGNHLCAALPQQWPAWSPEQLRAWLLAYSHRIAWSLESTAETLPRAAA